MILGLTGKFAAGKGTVAETLVELGFRYHSLSDVLRDELTRRGVPESRASLHALGNELRAEHGPNALAKLILPRLREAGDHIVDSIRTPGEVETLRSLADFVLIGVDADAMVRFERLLARGRQGDPKTHQEFVAFESRENASDDPAAQQLEATFALADRLIDNGGTRDDLRVGVLALLEQLRRGGPG